MIRGDRRVLPPRRRGGARQPRRDSAPRGPGAPRALGRLAISIGWSRAPTSHRPGRPAPRSRRSAGGWCSGILISWCASSCSDREESESGGRRRRAHHALVQLDPPALSGSSRPRSSSTGSAEPQSQAPDRDIARGPARPRLAARDRAADRPHARARGRVGRGAHLLGPLPHGGDPRRHSARDGARASACPLAHGRSVPRGSRGGARRAGRRLGGRDRGADPVRRAGGMRGPRPSPGSRAAGPSRSPRVSGRRTGRRATLGRPRPTRRRGGRRTRGISIRCCTSRARPRGATPTGGRLHLAEEAEAIDRVHPEVRRSRFRLLLASAERRIREGRFALALTDLDRLEEQRVAARGDTWAYLGAVRSVRLPAGAATVPAPSGCTRSWRHGSATPRQPGPP